MALLGCVGGSKSDSYSRIACDDARVSIRCPSGSKIRIKTAFYGRHDGSKCVAQSSTNARKKTQNTNCSLPQHITVGIIGDACDNNGACDFDLGATMSAYNDPCPDTSKYLEYSYECIKSSFECPGAVRGAVFTKDHFTAYRNDGGWTTDSMVSDKKKRDRV